MAGPPYTLEHAGRTYHARLIGKDAKREFARWLYGRYREIERDTAADERLTDEQLQANLAVLRDMHFSGQFGFLSPRGLAAAQTQDGIMYLMGFVFGLDELEMTSLLVAKKAEVVDLFRTIMRESFPESKATPDPNAPRPAAGYIPPHRPSKAGKASGTPVPPMPPAASSSGSEPSPPVSPTASAFP